MPGSPPISTTPPSTTPPPSTRSSSSRPLGVRATSAGPMAAACAWPAPAPASDWPRFFAAAGLGHGFHQGVPRAAARALAQPARAGGAAFGAGVGVLSLAMQPIYPLPGAHKKELLALAAVGQVMGNTARETPPRPPALQHPAPPGYTMNASAWSASCRSRAAGWAA